MLTGVETTLFDWWKLILGLLAIAGLFAFRSYVFRRRPPELEWATRPIPPVRFLFIQKARKLQSDGQFQKAGDLFLRACDSESAIGAYLEGGIYKAAAKLLEKRHDYAAATTAYEACGCFTQAAASAAKGGDYRRGADNHLTAGNKKEASRLLALNGSSLESGNLYLEIDELLKAAETFQKGGLYQEAGQAYRDHIEKAIGGGPHDGEDEFHAKRLKDLATRCARCFIAAQNPKDAAKAYMMVQAKPEAAIVYLEAGLDDDLYRVLDSMEDEDKAVDFLRSVGRIADVEVFRGRIGGAKRKILQSSIATPAPVVRSKTPNPLSPPSNRHFPTHSEDERRKPSKSQEDKSYDMESIVSADKAKMILQSQRYLIKQIIGHGGMGAVYRARDLLLDRDVALKVMVQSADNDPGKRDDFIREARSAARLNHPNIVTIFDFDETNDVPYIALELIEGTTLRELLDKDGPLEWDLFCKVAGQLCDALDYAHKKGVIHRDIKPANLMWTTSESLKVTDFGLAKVLQDGMQSGEASRILGTPHYMAPEQILGDGVNHRTDIYGLGVTLFELVIGRVPFKGANVVRQHLESPAPPLRMLRPDLPQSCERAILRCLGKNPNDRPASALIVKEDLGLKASS